MALKSREVIVTGADVSDGKEVAAVIPVRELQKARREPKWLAFREAALEERRRLKENGQSS